MLLPLQTLDITQYEFEEFCEKWAFTLYERAISDKFNGDYDQFWDDFNKIKPDIWVKYYYVTSLKTKVKFKPVSSSKWEKYWQFNIEQIK